MNCEEPIKYKKRVILALFLLTVIPVLVVALPAATISSIENRLNINAIIAFPAASYTSFPLVANAYYLFAAICILIQNGVVVWYSARLPIERLGYLREVYAAEEKWLSLHGVTLVNRKWGILIICAIFFVGTLVAEFYLGPGFGIRNSHGRGKEVFMFFTMNVLGVISLMLYTALFTMWSRLIHSDKDI